MKNVWTMTNNLKPTDAGLINALATQAHGGIPHFLAIGADVNCLLACVRF